MAGHCMSSAIFRSGKLDDPAFPTTTNGCCHIKDSFAAPSSDFNFALVQWAVGFATFWYPGGSRNSRVTLLPWHVFFGAFIYALAVVTATTGLLEKATFLQTNKTISRYSNEAFLINFLGIFLVLLGGLVILVIITPQPPTTDPQRKL